MKRILVEREGQLLVVDEAAATDRVIARDSLAIAHALRRNAAWQARMREQRSVFEDEYTRHRDDLDWLMFAGVFSEHLDAAQALIAAGAWSSAAHALILAGFANPLQLRYASEKQYYRQMAEWAKHLPAYAVRDGFPIGMKPYAEAHAAERAYAHRTYDEMARPATEYVFSLPHHVRVCLANAMRRWPEDNDREFSQADPNYRCKGGAYRKWLVQNAVDLVLAE